MALPLLLHRSVGRGFVVIMKAIQLAATWSLLSACGGAAFASALDADAGAGDVLEIDQVKEADVLEQLDAAADVLHQANELDVLEHRDAVAGDVAGDAVLEHVEEVDASEALPCDPSYGDASPGGPCCVHVWATPSVGGVLCTVDGSRWCWQTGEPCSPPGARCLTVNAVTYCAP